MDKKAARIMNVQLNGFKAGMLEKCALTGDVLGGALGLTAGTPLIGAIIGALRANEGKRMMGAGYGALQGMALPMGMGLGALGGGLGGGLLGNYLEPPKGDSKVSNEALVGMIGGGAGGAGLGGLAAWKLVNALAGQKALEEMYGEKEEEPE